MSEMDLDAAVEAALAAWSARHTRQVCGSPREHVGALIKAAAPLIAAAALRDAEVALNTEGLDFNPGGWGSNPVDLARIGALQQVREWLRDRADRIEAAT